MPADVHHPRTVPYWLDSPSAPSPSEALVGQVNTDLAVVGGGFSGLWTALLAKEADPGRDVVVLESATIGSAASGRNGGFVAASLTHGLPNGAARWPHEIGALHRMGLANLDELEKSLAQHGIEASFERTGELTVATEEWQLDALLEVVELAAHHGIDAPLVLDAEQVRSRISSPRFLGGLLDLSTALVDPARLAWGLMAACRRMGVRVYEHSHVTGMSDEGATVLLRTRATGAEPGREGGAGDAPAVGGVSDVGGPDGGTAGSVRARSVALCTNAFPSLVRRVRPFVVPVYDYVLMTEPLRDAQRREIGWAGREGLADAGNLFHYSRLTDDGRILWGGYDAVYHYGNAIRPELDQRPATFALLREQLVDTFPALRDVAISHQWGGVIDTCTRFSPFWGTALAGKVAYVLGYTGLGVGASRFGAQVVLDLLAGADTERTRLSMVRRRPIPFPPEPVRSAAIALTRRSIARADARGGRRDAWLRTLDRLGLGFDS